MAAFKAFSRLRRSISSSSLCRARQYHFLSNPNPKSTAIHSSLLRPLPRRDRLNLAPTNAVSLAGALGSFSSRSIFTRSEDDSEITDPGGFDLDSVTEFTELATESKVLDSGLISSGEESILPVRTVISMLDNIHEFTGLPWWIVIACSTLALRVTLFPLLIFQLHKLKRIGELFPQLPSPFPPPFSGKSYVDHISKFREKRKAIGCPSFLWFFPYFCVQVPCFFLWMTTIRRMSLDHHPGFDCGGALWFHNLTEYSHGALGSVFPILIAGLHYTNIQISVRTPFASTRNDLFSLLFKYYKFYLDILTLPILITCYYVPQGSLVYWVLNSSLTCIQQFSLSRPSVREKLGLPETKPSSAINAANVDSLALPPTNKSEKKKIVLEDLSPQELVALSVQQSSKGQKDKALHVLKVALSKDPEYPRALILMGQILLQNGMISESIEHLERVISKLTLAGYPTEVEDIDHLILASTWAGSAYTRQGKLEEGLLHFERIVFSKEPEDPKVKAHYFDGLLMYSSALYNAGRKEEAKNYLQLVAAYNPEYNKFLEELEKEGDSVDTELSDSRRRDY